MNKYGYTTLTVVLSIALMAIGLTVGYIALNSDTPLTFESEAANNQFVNAYHPNIQVDAQKNTPSRWDHSVEGSLCYNVNPPTGGRSNYRVVIKMDLRDEDNPSVINRGEIIGASPTKLIEAQAKLGCQSSGSRTSPERFFNAVFNTPPRDRWVDDCPRVEVHVETEGNWKPHPGPHPEFQDAGADSWLIGYLDESVLGCTRPTAEPTNVPQQQPTIDTSASVSGTLTVFSCGQPETASINFCDSRKLQCGTLEETSGPSDDGIWLSDVTNDRTYIYNYNISTDPLEIPLGLGDSVNIEDAFARIDTFGGNARTFTSAPEPQKIVTAPGTRDLTINAKDQTCSCTFNSTAYVKDEDGNITNILDGGLNGVSNDLNITAQSTREFDKEYSGVPILKFSDGVIKTEEAIDFWDLRENTSVDFPYGPFGKDGLVDVRLYAPEYDVIGQECTSNGETHACPGETFVYDENFPANDEGKDFRGLRVACGVDVEYGWIVKKKPASRLPSPEPSEEPEPSEPPQQSGSNDIYLGYNGTYRNSSDCTPKGFGATEVKTSGTGVNFSWDRLGSSCPDFEDGRDRYMIVIKNGDRVVATKAGMKDVDTDVKADENENDLLPPGVTVQSDGEYLRGVTYTALLYAYMDSDPSNISEPDVALFTGIGKDNPGGGDNGTSGNEDFNSFNMILLDADDNDIQCYASYKDGENDIHKDGEQNGSRGGYSCSHSANGDQLSITLRNNNLSKSPKNNAINENASRMKWQTHRCADGEFPCQKEGDYVDRMTEAADWFCVAPGEQIECRWDLSEWKSTPPAVECFLNGRSLKQGNYYQRNCRYPSFTLGDGTIVTLAQLDLNNDYIINSADISACLAEYGQSGSGLACDVNGDGSTNALDYSLMTAAVGSEVPEDQR